MEVGIVLATASGGCASVCGGSPIIYRDSERFPKSSYSFEIHFEKITGVILTTESHG